MITLHLEETNVTFAILDIKLFLYVLIPIRRKHPQTLSRDSCTYGCVDGGFLPVVLPTSNHPTINAGNRGARRPKQSGPGMLCHQAQIAQPEPGTPCHSIAVWCPAHAQQVWRLCQSRLALTSSSQRSGTALSCNIYHQCFCNFQPLWEGPQRVQPWPRCGHREAGLL